MTEEKAYSDATAKPCLMKAEVAFWNKPGDIAQTVEVRGLNKARVEQAAEIIASAFNGCHGDAEPVGRLEPGSPVTLLEELTNAKQTVLNVREVLEGHRDALLAVHVEQGLIHNMEAIDTEAGLAAAFTGLGDVMHTLDRAYAEESARCGAPKTKEDVAPIVKPETLALIDDRVKQLSAQILRLDAHELLQQNDDASRLRGNLKLLKAAQLDGDWSHLSDAKIADAEPGADPEGAALARFKKREATRRTGWEL